MNPFFETAALQFACIERILGLWALSAFYAAHLCRSLSGRSLPMP